MNGLISQFALLTKEPILALLENVKDWEASSYDISPSLSSLLRSWLEGQPLGEDVWHSLLPILRLTTVDDAAAILAQAVKFGELDRKGQLSEVTSEVVDAALSLVTSDDVVLFMEEVPPETLAVAAETRLCRIAKGEEKTDRHMSRLVGATSVNTNVGDIILPYLADDDLRTKPTIEILIELYQVGRAVNATDLVKQMIVVLSDEPSDAIAEQLGRLAGVGNLDGEFDDTLKTLKGNRKTKSQVAAFVRGLKRQGN